jgi:hypothetical protein
VGRFTEQRLEKRFIDGNNIMRECSILSGKHRFCQSAIRKDSVVQGILP